MGNYNTRSIRFLQSPFDFPCPVALGKDTPSFGLHRFNQALRFVPPDDEGFTMRGDKRRLVYKGRKRSHRITILGDTTFEYDCILEREPESNVVTLLMEGAEHFDFFRQPDFVPDPFLKGSYAVYKKETILGEGTGKLCHIHRPLIIDARGRKVWGDLSIVGNELRITIPEQWLAEAKYPVVVDPTVGTTTVGSQNKWVMEPGEPAEPLMFELSIPVNRFLVPETINGICTAYAYVNQDDYEAGGRPVFYSDNGNSPLTRKSIEEGFIDLRVTSSKPVGWRSATFKSNGSITNGSYIWFGVFCEYYWMPRFDWGAKCYADWWDAYTSIPTTYPITKWTEIYDFKLSMYFTYTSAQNYIRTITHGVTITDNRILKADYKRSAIQTARVNTSMSRFETFYRKCEMNLSNTMSMSRFLYFSRTVTESIKATLEKKESRSLSRMCIDDVEVKTESKRSVNVIRTIQDSLKGLDSQSVVLLYVRSVTDEAIATHKTSHWGAFIRGLLVTAGSNAETTHGANYYRFQADKVQAEGSVFRGLLLFVKIVTGVFVRDYLLRRFLVAREELVLKSCITREIILDSKIN
ncbi:MAG: hypothetical protein LBC80_05485 [Treponema sp.]|jgi:hypothetical protein|nr:hypothetical protein [Treponema sp.]